MSRSQGSTLPKRDCHALPLFALDNHFEAVFNFYFNRRQDQAGAPNPRMGVCGNPVFGLRQTLRTGPRACCQSTHVVWNCLGCCCRRLSQYGVGEVLIPLRHCWRDAFFVFALAVDRFVTIGRCTAQFCFGLLMRYLFLGFPYTPNAATLRVGGVGTPAKTHLEWGKG